jgi:branched-chain amino acid transport system permease protein
MNIVIGTIIYAYMAYSWNITGGYGGQLLFGHISFFGLGAYTTLILLTKFGISPWIGIPLSAIPASLFGLFISFLSLRYKLKTDYFALFTIGMMVVLRILFGRWNFVGAAKGLWVEFQGVSFSQMVFVDKAPYLYIGLALLLFALVISFWIFQTKIGSYLFAIREDEDGAAALGINVSLYKTIAVLITAALHGMGGGFYAVFTTFIQPILIFGFPLNVEFLVSTVIGGRGTILGPLLGALIYKPFSDISRGLFSGGLAGSTVFVYGLFLIIFVLFIPQGVVGWLHKIFEKFKKGKN